MGYATSLVEADKIVNEINKGLGEAFAYKADVRIYEEMQGMIDETVRRWGRIDTLVNSAGGTLARLTGKENKMLLETSEEEWNLVVDVNLKGTFNCLKVVVPQMIKQGGGHIILVSSGVGLRPLRRMACYAAAKAGVLGLMKAAAREFGEYNIKVNAVCPGLIPHKFLPLGGLSPGNVVSEQTLGRLSTAEDFADFLVHISQMNNTSG